MRGDLTAEHRAELQSRLYFEIREGGTVLQTLPAAALGDWKQNGSDWWISKSIPISDEWVGKTVDVVECSYEMDDLSYTVTTEKVWADDAQPTQPAQILLRQRLSEIRRNADGGKIVNGTDTSGSFLCCVLASSLIPTPGRKRRCMRSSR